MAFSIQKLLDMGITHYKILGHLTTVTAPTERHCRSDIALSKCSIIFLFKLNPSSKKPRFFFQCQKQFNLRWRFTNKIWRPNCITARHVTIIVCIKPYMNASLFLFFLQYFMHIRLHWNQFIKFNIAIFTVLLIQFISNEISNSFFCKKIIKTPYSHPTNPTKQQQQPLSSK